MCGGGGGQVFVFLRVGGGIHLDFSYNYDRQNIPLISKFKLVFVIKFTQNEIKLKLNAKKFSLENIQNIFLKLIFYIASICIPFLGKATVFDILCPI